MGQRRPRTLLSYHPSMLAGMAAAMFIVTAQAVAAGQGASPATIRGLVEDVRLHGDNGRSGLALQQAGPAAMPYILAALGQDKGWENVAELIKRLWPDDAANLPRWTTLALNPAHPVGQRIAALRMLTLSGTRETAPALRPLLRDGNRRVANAAREALRAMADVSVFDGAGACNGSMGDGKALPYTSEDFDTDCIERIAAYGPVAKRAAPVLIGRFINSRNGHDRALVAGFVGYVGYEPAIPRLIALLNDPDWRVVYVAARSLGWLHADGATPALTRAAETHWLPEVREEAAAVLAALRPGGAPLPKPDIRSGSRWRPTVDLDVNATSVPDVAPCKSGRWIFRDIVFRERDHQTEEVQIAAEGSLPAGKALGVDDGEFGGGLFWQEAGGKPTALFQTNAIAIEPAAGGVVAAFGEVGVFKPYDPNPPKTGAGLNETFISNGPSGYGFVLSAIRDAGGNWRLTEVARLPRSPDAMTTIAPGLFAALSGNRAVVFSLRGIEGVAACNVKS